MPVFVSTSLGRNSDDSILLFKIIYNYAAKGR